jgi:hypothetical protein
LWHGLRLEWSPNFINLKCCVDPRPNTAKFLPGARGISHVQRSAPAATAMDFPRHTVFASFDANKPPSWDRFIECDERDVNVTVCVSVREWARVRDCV